MEGINYPERHENIIFAFADNELNRDETENESITNIEDENAAEL